MPVHGLYSKSKEISREGNDYYQSIVSSRQSAPYSQGFYTNTKGGMMAKDWTNSSSLHASIGRVQYNGSVGAEEEIARDIAYRRLMAKALPRASALVNAAQYKTSFQMIALRSNQLVRSFRALKRGNFREVSRILTLNGKQARKLQPTWKDFRSDIAGTWLELTFGWKPLITDIYNAVDVLQTSFPLARVRGSGSKVAHSQWRDDWGGGGSETFAINARVSALLRVDNPNLLLANQLGLLNPAAVVWDIIPFSFVVDWFIPVGKFISTFNDQVGISLVDGVTSVSKSCATTHFYYSNRQSGEAKSFTRTPGEIQKPSWPTQLRVPTGSLWLAATSVALVNQTFGNFKLK